MYNPLQARDPLGKWVKEHGGASIEDVVAKTSMVDLENMALDDRTPTAVLNNLATTEYGFNIRSRRMRPIRMRTANHRRTRGRTGIITSNSWSDMIPRFVARQSNVVPMIPR